MREDLEKLERHSEDEIEQYEALVEEMRDKYHEELAQGPAIFEPDPVLRGILMKIVQFDQLKRLLKR